MVAFPAMKIAALRLLLGLLARLPLPLVRWMGRGLGALPVGGRRRRVASNLATAFPEAGSAERTRLARRNRQAMMTTLMETALFGGRSRDWLMRHWAPDEQWSRVEEAMASGRGLLLDLPFSGRVTDTFQQEVIHSAELLARRYQALHRPAPQPTQERAQRRDFGRINPDRERMRTYRPDNTATRSRYIRDHERTHSHQREHQHHLHQGM